VKSCNVKQSNLLPDAATFYPMINHTESISMLSNLALTKSDYKKSRRISSLGITALMTMGLWVGTQGLLTSSMAVARTVARAHGRCKVTTRYPDGANPTIFDGYCTSKQMQNGDRTVFVVELDNGNSYRFAGPSRDSLQIETSTGMHNVRYNQETDRGSFAWEDEGLRHRLGVKLDTEHPPTASHDTPSTSSGGNNSLGKVLLGAAAGALLGALLGGNKNSTPAVRPGDEVPSLKDLVGARAGQAEGTLRQRGYESRKGSQMGDSAFTNWLEQKTGNCVLVRTTDGRYASILYTNKDDCK
jgi:hypothetical protein